jgi:uncharacterized tellurite resistance protein B-like protein
MKYTDIEKTAVARVLFQIMSADGVIEDLELDLQTKIVSSLGITDDSFIITVVIFPLDKAVEIIRTMTEDKKSETGKFIAKMIVVDGYVDQKELEFSASIEKSADIEIVKYITE